jgi:hypothetical protein
MKDITILVIVIASGVFFMVEGYKASPTKTHSYIECDNGFMTENSAHAYSTRGVVSWKTKDSHWYTYHVPEGVTCWKERIYE